MTEVKNKLDANGQRHGLWENCFHFKLKSSEGYYNHGIEEGLWKYYYKSGEVSGIVHYKNGRPINLKQMLKVSGAISYEEINIR